MVIEDEVTNNRSISSTSRNTDQTETKSQDNVDTGFIQEQIAKVFNIWSDISRLPTGWALLRLFTTFEIGSKGSY